MTAAVDRLTPEQARLVEANLGLVGHVVHRVLRVPADRVDDARAAGYLGLIRAAQKYDPTVARFSTYAVIWIRQAIQKDRRDLEGRSFRSMMDGRGAPWHEPARLDAPIADLDGDVLTLAGLLTSPDDVEADTVDTVAGELLAARILDRCVDPLDRAIVLGLLDGRLRPQLAADLGITAEAIRLRLGRLRRRLGPLEHLDRPDAGHAGSRARYNAGCRCVPCRDANTAYARRRARRRDALEAAS